MSKDRGMMKWAPYKSLIEQEDALKTAKKLKEKVEKPIISSDEIEEINRILTEYHFQLIKIRYWENGIIKEESGIISKIDTYLKIILINNTKINLSSIIGIDEL